MSVRKEPNGRFRAVLKSGRQHVTSKTFDTKREANEWLSRERAALVGGIDPRAGRVRTRDLLVQWLEVRAVTVAKKTYRTDQDLLRLMPISMQNMGVAAISARECPAPSRASSSRAWQSPRWFATAPAFRASSPGASVNGSSRRIR